MDFIIFALALNAQLDHHCTHNFEPELHHNVHYIINNRFCRNFTMVCLNKTETLNAIFKLHQPTGAAEVINYYSEQTSLSMEIKQLIKWTRRRNSVPPSLVAKILNQLFWQYGSTLSEIL
jgi:hypothetical protein